MHRARPCPPDDYLEAIAAGPADPAARGPPAGAAEPVRRLRRAARRRHRRLGRRLARHRRPREPRAALAGARPPARGHRGPRLRARPPAHDLPGVRARPRALARPERMRFPVHGPLRRRGPRPRRPGGVFPEQITAAADAGTGAEVVQIGRRIHRLVLRRAGVAAVARARLGRRLGRAAGRRGARRRARSARRSARTRSSRCSRPAAPRSPRWPRWPTSCGARAVGDVVTFVAQPQHQLHERLHLQVPVLRLLEGPAVAQPAGHAVPADARRHHRAGARGRTTSAPPRCACQGGIHPSFDGDYYIDVTRAVKDAVARDPHPRLHRARGHRGRQAPRRAAGRLPAPAHGRRPEDAARHRGRDPRRRGPRHPVPRQDQHRGVARGPPHRPLGRAALEHHDHVRVGRAAACSWARHLVRTRDLQKETGGFTEFVPLPFVHMAAPIYLQRKARRGPTFREALLMHAVGRIAYHGWIDNIQVSWVKLGLDGVAPAAPGRRQRPRRHADGREHLPRRRRVPRPTWRTTTSGRWSSRSAARSSSAPRSTPTSATAPTRSR